MWVFCRDLWFKYMMEQINHLNFDDYEFSFSATMKHNIY